MADVVIASGPIVSFDGENWKARHDVTNQRRFGPTSNGDDPQPAPQTISADLLDNLNESPSTPSSNILHHHRFIDPSWLRNATNVVGGGGGVWCHCLGPRYSNHRVVGATPPASRSPDTATTETVNGDNRIHRSVEDDNSSSKMTNTSSKMTNTTEQNDQPIQLEILEINLTKDLEWFGDDEPGEEVEEEKEEEVMEISCLSASSCSEEAIKSADEVISELVEMMEDDLDSHFPSYSRSLSKSTESVQMELQQMMSSGPGLTSCLKDMSSDGLNALREQLELAIQDYSEVLLCCLVLREELGFQKELFNQFISLLLSIQKKKRRMTEVDRKKNRPSGADPTYRYLTTVIPYDDHQRLPDVDLLQVYIKLLSAIDEDNSKVPALLTEYILNVLCPKT